MTRPLAEAACWFQFHQQVDHGADVGAAVGVVAGLDQGGVAARPLPVGVQQLGLLQDVDKGVQGPVDVADGHNPGGRLSGRQPDGQTGQNDGKRDPKLAHAVNFEPTRCFGAGVRMARFAQFLPFRRFLLRRLESLSVPLTDKSWLELTSTSWRFWA